VKLHGFMCNVERVGDKRWRLVFPYPQFESILDVIELTAEAMQHLRGTKPRLGVLGLNPHAGERGLFGNGEEERIIIPAMEAAQAKGIGVEGPIPPDTAFIPAKRRSMDAFICMYHDQGHIPLKALAFDTLSHCLAALERDRVYLCLEPLTPAETNFMTSAAEGVALAKRLGLTTQDVVIEALRALEVDQCISADQSNEQAVNQVRQIFDEARRELWGGNEPPPFDKKAADDWLYDENGLPH